MHESEVKDQRQAVAFRFLTWNLSMLVTSAQAPEGWDGEYTEQAISRFIEREQPHWVFLQEVSGLVPPFVDGYVLIRQQVESHCGNVMTLLHRDLAELPITHTVVDRFAVLSELHGMDTAIANVHLAPGKTAAPTRLEMLARLREVTSASRLLIVGDTNTRLAEVSKIGRLGFTGESPRSPRGTVGEIDFVAASAAIRPITRAISRAAICGSGKSPCTIVHCMSTADDSSCRIISRYPERWQFRSTRSSNHRMTFGRTALAMLRRTLAFAPRPSLG